MTLYVGTSGWAYREWKPGFYPVDLPQDRFLDHYATKLTACEINATFYRLQTEETFARWARSTPEPFRFAAKAHRRLTHARSFDPTGDQRDFLDRFMRSLAPLEARLGGVLFQFPPTRIRDDNSLNRLLDALPREAACAFEFRHDSWSHPKVEKAIAARGGTRCIGDTTGDPPKALPPGPIAYVRMKAETYTSDQRAQWAELLRSEAQQRDVYVFAKHEGAPVDDDHTGIGLAEWMVTTSSS